MIGRRHEAPGEAPSPVGARTSSPSVGVIIVNYNGGAMLVDCLAELEKQTVRPTRVLVLDNGSRDDSVAACRGKFPWVEFHLLNANLGFARANNIGIEMAADCEWVALLNPDAFATPSWIEAFERRALEFPDIDEFASCMITAQDSAIVDGAGDAYRVDGVAWPRYQGSTTRRLGREPAEVFSASGGAGFYRRRTVVAAGGFCERYFCYYEDVDLGFRLRLAGGRCRLMPDAVVRHMGSAITGKGSDFSVYYAQRNIVWTYLRNMPGLYVWLYLPAHIAINLASVAQFIRKGQGRVVLKAKWDALKGVPRSIQERRAIQRTRVVAPGEVLASMERGNVFGTMARRALRMLRPAPG